MVPHCPGPRGQDRRPWRLVGPRTPLLPSPAPEKCNPNHSLAGPCPLVGQLQTPIRTAPKAVGGQQPAACGWRQKRLVDVASWTKPAGLGSIGSRLSF